MPVSDESTTMGTTRASGASARDSGISDMDSSASDLDAAAKPLTGWITNIQRFSLHDGPGIRTTVFLKGCTNACRWCHNPETLRAKPEIQWFPALCIGCGRCIEVCPEGAHRVENGVKSYDRRVCRVCGECAEECYAGSLVLTGKEATVTEVVEEALRDRPYYDHSGGGVTLSGGEPAMQPAFSEAILDACCSEGVHTAIQTAGNVPWENLARLLPRTDLVMLDVKIFDPDLHLRFVGNDGSRIRENLSRLLAEEANLVVRTPVIGGVNDTEEEIRAIAGLLSGARRLLYYELLPYHPMGGGKYESLGRDAPPEFTTPSKERMKELADAARGLLPEVKP